MRYLIFLLTILLLVGCNEKQATERLILGFIVLSESADAQVDSINKLRDAGKIDPEEAEAFTRWTEPLIQASDEAVSILGRTETPFEARVTKALHIFAAGQQKVIFEKTSNPHILSSYFAVDAALRVLSARLDYAKAKAGLEKTQ